MLLIGYIGERTAHSAKKKPRSRPPAPVVLQTVESELLTLQATVTGNLRPLQKIFLSVEESGRVTKIHKRQGDLVQKGKLLAEIKNPSLSARFELQKSTSKEVQIQLKFLKKKWLLTQELSKKKIATPVQLEEDKARYFLQMVKLESTVIEIQRLENLLKSFQVKAPFDGQILKAPLELGQWVTPATVLYQVVSYQMYELDVSVPGRYLGQIPINQKVSVQVKEAKTFLEGKIHAIVQYVDETTGNFWVKIHVPNPEGLSLSGLLVEVSLPIGTPTERMLVSRDAIVRRGDKIYVVLSKNGIAQITPVKILGNQGDRVMIQAKDLKPGEQVVIRGNERLFSGMKIQVKPAISSP